MRVQNVMDFIVYKYIDTYIIYILVSQNTKFCCQNAVQSLGSAVAAAAVFTKGCVYPRPA